MCFNPLWRVPVSPAAQAFIFGTDKKGYRNGAYIISQKDPGRLQSILGRLELASPKNFARAQEGIVTIPCGKCQECKIDNSKQWAQRAVAESLLYPDSESWFITLTYDDDHLPSPVQTYSRHNLEFGLWSPLLYDDFELFKKRMLEFYRQEHGHVGIRFLMCGEYGPQNGRPHFHAIFYNLPIFDLQVLSSATVGGQNVTYLTSKKIEELWSKGFITIGQVNYDTSAYVARYVLKKFSSIEELQYQKLCKDLGWQPLPAEMRQASRRPGLGRGYYELHKDKIYSYDSITLPEGQISKPSQYFDRLYELENPELLKANKEKRKAIAELSQANKLRCSSIYSPAELEQKRQDVFTRKIRKLRRPL